MPAHGTGEDQDAVGQIEADVFALQFQVADPVALFGVEGQPAQLVAQFSGGPGRWQRERKTRQQNEDDYAERHASSVCPAQVQSTAGAA